MTANKSLQLSPDEFRQLQHVGYALEGLRDLCEENSSESVKQVASVLRPIHSEFADILYKISEGGAR